MLSTLHLGGRNYTCTEIKLSKIIVISAPDPPQLVKLWFQGNGSHLEALVSLHCSTSFLLAPLTTIFYLFRDAFTSVPPCAER